MQNSNANLQSNALPPRSSLLSLCTTVFDSLSGDASAQGYLRAVFIPLEVSLQEKNAGIGSRESRVRTSEQVLVQRLIDTVWIILRNQVHHGAEDLELVEAQRPTGPVPGENPEGFFWSLDLTEDGAYKRMLIAGRTRRLVTWYEVDLMHAQGEAALGTRMTDDDTRIDVHDGNGGVNLDGIVTQNAIAEADVELGKTSANDTNQQYTLDSEDYLALSMLCIDNDASESNLGRVPYSPVASSTEGVTSDTPDNKDENKDQVDRTLIEEPETEEESYLLDADATLGSTLTINIPARRGAVSALYRRNSDNDIPGPPIIENEVIDTVRHGTGIDPIVRNVSMHCPLPPAQVSADGAVPVCGANVLAAFSFIFGADQPERAPADAATVPLPKDSDDDLDSIEDDDGDIAAGVDDDHAKDGIVEEMEVKEGGKKGVAN